MAAITEIINNLPGGYSWPDNSCVSIAVELTKTLNGNEIEVPEWVNEPEAVAMKRVLREYKSSAQGYMEFLTQNGWEVQQEFMTPAYTTPESRPRPDDIVMLGGDVIISGTLWRAGKRRQMMAFVPEDCQYWGFSQHGLQPVTSARLDAVLRCRQSA